MPFRDSEKISGKSRACLRSLPVKNGYAVPRPMRPTRRLRWLNSLAKSARLGPQTLRKMHTKANVRYCCDACYTFAVRPCARTISCCWLEDRDITKHACMQNDHCCIVTCSWSATTEENSAQNSQLVLLSSYVVLEIHADYFCGPFGSPKVYPVQQLKQQSPCCAIVDETGVR